MVHVYLILNGKQTDSEMTPLGDKFPKDNPEATTLQTFSCLKNMCFI